MGRLSIVKFLTLPVRGLKKLSDVYFGYSEFAGYSTFSLLVTEMVKWLSKESEIPGFIWLAT